MKLSDAKLKHLKGKSSTYRVSDGGGLYVEVSPAGTRAWRYAYRIGGKQKTLAIGVYPDVGLALARERHAKARGQLANGLDPSEVKKLTRVAGAPAANTFEDVATEWLARFRGGWADNTFERKQGRLRRFAYPLIGPRPVDQVAPQDALLVLRSIEANGKLETAHRVRHAMGEVFKFAVATGRASRNVMLDIAGAIPTPTVTHMPALTSPVKVGEFLRAVDAYEGSPMVRCALRIMPHVFLRPGELRKGEWTEVADDQWEIPPQRMKMKRPHVVPLSTQVFAILQELRHWTGGSKYMFADLRDGARPMSDGTVNAALRRLGYAQGEITGHGFRATARTLLDEELGERFELIEHQLAHQVRDATGRAYNRTTHLPERAHMMQRWSDYLDSLRG